MLNQTADREREIARRFVVALRYDEKRQDFAVALADSFIVRFGEGGDILRLRFVVGLLAQYPNRRIFTFLRYGKIQLCHFSPLNRDNHLIQLLLRALCAENNDRAYLSRLPNRSPKYQQRSGKENCRKYRFIVLGKPCGNEDIKTDRLVVRILARQNGQRASPLAHEQDDAFNNYQGDEKPNHAVDLIDYARRADIENSRYHDKPDHGGEQYNKSAHPSQ